MNLVFCHQNRASKSKQASRQSPGKFASSSPVPDPIPQNQSNRAQPAPVRRPPKFPCRRNAFIHRDGAYQLVASPSILSPPAPVALADTTINRP
ncbi:uncharacterized protein TrAFT101_000635 [Trichoderma asperellum]|uniref:uncharacterized protein n=1 Tax=Trichoderma asperellum TaxID=101201 RepID=UPI00332016B4|nr:hypothetical protein TrAFT101_000635 [Trichoderma asperellum]